MVLTIYGSLGALLNANSQGRALALRLRTIGVYQWLPPTGVLMTLVGLFDKSHIFYGYDHSKFCLSSILE